MLKKKKKRNNHTPLRVYWKEITITTSNIFLLSKCFRTSGASIKSIFRFRRRHGGRCHDFSLGEHGWPGSGSIEGSGWTFSKAVCNAVHDLTRCLGSAVLWRFRSTRDNAALFHRRSYLVGTVAVPNDVYYPLAQQNKMPPVLYYPLVRGRISFPYKIHVKRRGLHRNFDPATTREVVPRHQGVLEHLQDSLENPDALWSSIAKLENLKQVKIHIGEIKYFHKKILFEDLVCINGYYVKKFCEDEGFVFWKYYLIWSWG